MLDLDISLFDDHAFDFGKERKKTLNTGYLNLPRLCSLIRFCKEKDTFNIGNIA